MGTLNGIRRFLLGWMNREFLIFLFFLAVAGIFWLLMTLNESFEQEVKIPVRYVNVPGNVVITSGENDTLRYTVRDKGISLITYIYSQPLQPLSIDFSRYAHDGRGTVSTSDLLRLADTRLPASAKAVGVKPDGLSFYYNNGESRRVPVKYRGTVEPDMLYYISDVVYQPDSMVTVYASAAMLDSISTVYTVPLSYSGFRDPLMVKARLQPMTGVKMVPDEVTILFQTDMLTEGTISDVPVVGINMPPGKVLRTFPAKLSVSFVTGMKNYQSISASDFLIVADYKEFSLTPEARCNVYLRRQPLGIQRVRLGQEQVDYLIEEHDAEQQPQ